MVYGKRIAQITPLETVKIVPFYHSATSVLLNVLLLIGVFLRYKIVTYRFYVSVVLSRLSMHVCCVFFQ